MAVVVVVVGVGVKGRARVVAARKDFDVLEAGKGRRRREALDDDGVALAPLARASALDEARLRTLRREHFEFIWRSVRRLGVPRIEPAAG